MTEVHKNKYKNTDWLLFTYDETRIVNFQDDRWVRERLKKSSDEWNE